MMFAPPLLCPLGQARPSSCDQRAALCLMGAAGPGGSEEGGNRRCT